MATAATVDGSTRRGSASIATRVLLAASLAVAAGIAGAAATPTSARADTEHHVTVEARRGWTDTGIDVHAADTATIAATDTVQFRESTSRVGAGGVPWGAACDRLERSQRVVGNWPAPGIACWSLIGRVGNGKPFAVGATTSVRMPATGRLFLGINDNYLSDNAGSWSVGVTVSATRSPAVSSPTAHHDSSGSSALLLVVFALIAIAVLVALIVFFRRRTRAGDEHAGSVGATPEATSALMAGGVGYETERLVPTDDDQTVVPDESDAAHVNIFEVELTADALRVGYNQFPEGVAVEWIVRDGMTPRARRSFVTQGGGETEHYVSFPVEVPASANGKAMTVEFRWTIGDVPFTYSVQRAPGGDASAAVDTPVE